MKKIKLSILAFVSVSSMVFAGGEIDAPLVSLDEATSTIDASGIHSDFYVGLALSAVSTRESGVSLSFTSVNKGADRLGNVSFLAGYDFNDYITVEGRYTTSFAKDDTTQMSGFSIFAKPQYAVSEDFSLYGLLGYGTVTLDSATVHNNVDVDDIGFQWGLGANYKVSNEVSVFVDYTSLANDMDGSYIHANSADVDALTVGVTYRF